MNISMQINCKAELDIEAFIEKAMIGVNDTHFYIMHSIVKHEGDNIIYYVSMVKPCGAYASSFGNAVNIFLHACVESKLINEIE